jgi:hypothetical protein
VSRLYLLASMFAVVLTPGNAADTYGNPIIKDTLAGPAIIRHDGAYYLDVVQLPGFRITVQPMSSPTEPAGEPRVIIQPESDWETRAGHVTESPCWTRCGSTSRGCCGSNGLSSAGSPTGVPPQFPQRWLGTEVVPEPGIVPRAREDMLPIDHAGGPGPGPNYGGG